jgi:hypothetical protein
MENHINAADNAGLAADLIAKATTEEKVVEPALITPPSDTLVTLPGGYVSATGEVLKTVEVRELNGRDEEMIIRAGTSARMFSAILSRGTVMVGDQKVTEEILDNLLVGDRDAILLGIHRATFGSEAELFTWCEGCRDTKTVQVDTRSDLKEKILVDQNDRTFTVKGKKSEFLVKLPTGVVQKKIMSDPDLNPAEQISVLLENTVLEIDGRNVISPAQVQAMSVPDRRKIALEIAERNPGPQFDDIKLNCPDCESEVTVPISLGALFRF